MDPQKLPYLPPHFFYYQFTAGQKRLFLGLMALLLLAVGYWGYAYSYPTNWALQVSPVAETYAELLPVDTVNHAYRNFPINFQVYRQQVGYSASPLRPQAHPFAIAFGLLLLAWASLLAVSSGIDSQWSFLFYLLFGYFLHSTGAALQILPDPLWGRILEFGVIVAFLGIAYLCQIRILRIPLAGRLLLFGVMLLLLFGTAVQRQDWLVVHNMVGQSFVYLTVLSLAFLLFIAKFPSNLLLFLATNRPKPQQRLAPRTILVVFAMWLLIPFLWLNEFLNWNLIPISSGLRPSHMLMAAAVLTIFLSQNHFHQVRGIFKTTANFTMLLISWSIISVVTWFVFTASFDPLWMFAIDRLAAIAFAAVGIGHIFFAFTNHRPLLQRRLNGYYLMANGPRFPIGVVWLIGLIFIILGEGVESWKSRRLFSHSYAIQLADHSLLAGDKEQARFYYQIALQAAEGSPKANYNLASLLLEKPDQILTAVRYYEQAGRRGDFSYGSLNAANILLLNNRGEAAEEILRKGVEQFPEDPLLWTSLGNFYYKSQQPDSAISAYQRALQADLDLGPVYSNLAQLYWQYERPEDATAFFQAGLRVPAPGSSTLISAIWYQIVSGQSLDIPASTTHGYDSPLLTYNEQLLTVDEVPSVAEREQVRQFADNSQTPNALMLDAYQMLQVDSVEFGVSRMKFLTNQHPRYRVLGNYLLGVHFFQRDLPEIAKTYFMDAWESMAGSARDPQAFLYAAKMDIDLGRLSAANDSLSILRSRYEELWEPCAREISLLLRAVGQPLYAQTEWPYEGLTLDERIRLGRYADSTQYFSIALSTYQDVVSEDSNSLAPYLEMGNIYNRYCDSLALVNLSLGVQKAPQNVALRLEYAEAWLCQHEPEKAAEQLEGLVITKTDQQDYDRVQAMITLARGDTATAQAQLDSLIRRDPWDRESILQLGRLYQAAGDVYEGNMLFAEALSYNDQHPGLWRGYAWFTRAAGDQKAAQYGVQQAMRLAFTSAERQEIEEEFAEISLSDASLEK